MNLKFAFVLILSATLIACGSKSDNKSTSGAPAPAPANPDNRGGTTPEDLNANPIEKPELPAAPGGLKLGELKTLKLTVKSKTVLNDMLQSGSSVWIQGGKTLTDTSLLAKASAFCAFDTRWGTPTLKVGDKLDFTEIKFFEKTAALYTADGKIPLLCGKTGTKTAWSTADLAEAFGAAAQFTPSK